METSKFESIRPYTDEETAAAMKEIASAPLLSMASMTFFPEKGPQYLSEAIANVHSIQDFQKLVIRQIVERVIAMTVSEFSYDGIGNISGIGGRYLAMSNHRDIILDPAITQLVLDRNGLDTTEIAVGDNLITSRMVEHLFRSNRMIKVIRGVSSRELYLSSQMLSEYIRTTITSGKASVWLAQRQGRTKDGNDVTEQGLLKMLDMSGRGSFMDNFMELNIVPLSISYEYEPCDILKAREVLISRTQKYVKAEGEDTNSILVGIRQKKGNVHLSIGRPLAAEEIEAASLCDKNDRYQLIRDTVSRRIVEGYRLWKTNYIAADILAGGDAHSGFYTPEDRASFLSYMEAQLSLMKDEGLDMDELGKIFLGIYANPVFSKEALLQK